MPKPTVTTKCGAQRYANANERIIEFHGVQPETGGLISFAPDLQNPDGGLLVTLYRLDEHVRVVWTHKT